jgi:hypothetical protein
MEGRYAGGNDYGFFDFHLSKSIYGCYNKRKQGFLYRTQCAVLIEGNLNVEALKVALQTVVNRHEILRTAFHCLPGRTIPLQIITDSSLPPIHKHNLSDLASPEQATRIEAIFQETRQLHFDFEPGSNLHLSLVILSPNRHLLILSLPALVQIV